MSYCDYLPGLRHPCTELGRSGEASNRKFQFYSVIDP